MASTVVAGLARLRPGLAAQHPSIDPKEWYPILGSNPAALEPFARDGYVWVEILGRARQLPASILLVDRRHSDRRSAPRDTLANPGRRDNGR